MPAKHHQQSHYFEILNLFAIAAIIMSAFILRDQMNSFVITLFTGTYFIANVVYAAKTHHLDAMRVIEIGLIAAICQILLINYAI